MKDGVMDKDSIEFKDRGLRVSIFRWGFIDNSKLYFCIFFPWMVFYNNDDRAEI
jgi:hypothetical protein